MAIKGLGTHLLVGPRYPALYGYLAWYGRSFLQPLIVEALERWPVTDVSRVVDVGGGPHVWFGTAIARAYLGIDRIICVDKRDAPRVDVCADLETAAGRFKLKNSLREGDLLVFSEFWHCIAPTKRAELAHALGGFDWIVLEFDTSHPVYGNSYKRQLESFGASPLNSDEMLKIFQWKGKISPKPAVVSWGCRDLAPYKLFWSGKA